MSQPRTTTALPLTFLFFFLPVAGCGDGSGDSSDVSGDGDISEDLRLSEDLTFVEDSGADIEDAAGDAGPDVPAPGETGSTCETDNDCTGAFCLAVLGGEDRLCTNLCANNDDCLLADWSCLLVTNTGDDAVRVCVPDAVCFDNDNDGFGRGPACMGPDCNDDDDSVFLGADEVCNGADDDCDGIVDEFFVGFNEACDTGFEGACQGGRQACIEGSPVCVPTIEPVAEICNGVDDDCDGSIDTLDGGALISSVCYSGAVGTLDVGICRGGTRTCTDGILGTCAGEVLPSPVELCNGLDDDCDGEVDEDDPFGGVRCETGEPGVCAFGTTLCEAGETTCVADIVAGDRLEICNGLDDDCDGIVDENESGEPIVTACYTGPAGTLEVGVCQGGTRTCDAGSLGSCVGEVRPSSVELCNGLDDDCDGSVDEGNPFGGVRCETGVAGVCSLGITRCEEGESICVADIAAGARPEICNGLDDDCDGATDENASGQPISTACYSGPAGTLGVGVCRGGTSTCDGGLLGTCAGEIRPSPVELCNGIDDDCDGSVDEDDPFGGFRCETGDEGICRLGTTLCEEGATVCVADVRPGDEEEVCNGLDDDCNGSIDDLDVALCPLQVGVCQGSVGACRPSGGSLACTFVDYGDDYEFVEVSCDGLDNDCNGIIDDVDLDRDGYIDEACGGDDCEDRIAFINPGAEEICGNSTDEDCSGVIGDRDADGDGAFDNDPRCEAPGTDCNDNNENIRPGAAEIRDALDNDCDQQWDEGLIRSGDLIINEVMKDPDSVSDIRGEWFEVYNATDFTMALNSFRFADTGIDFFDISPLVVITIPARGYAVLCDFADISINGAIDCDYEYDNFLLGNNSDTIIARHLGVEIDRVTYTSAWPGNSGGRSMAFKQSLLGGATADVTENDAVGNWCSTPNNTANRMPGGDYGSPGRVNTCP
jgi:hypothetical protein